MNKNLRSLLLACLVASGTSAFPLPTRADDTYTLQAHSLAIVDRVLEYCGSVDPAMAAKLRDKVSELTKGLTEQQVADLRQTADYQSAYASMDEFVSKVDEHNTKRLCSESATPEARSKSTN